MEVLTQRPSMDFNFDSVSSTPFSSAPSSPRLFNRDVYFSAPTSPSHSVSPYYREISFVQRSGDSAVPVDSAVRDNSFDNEAVQDFAFDFSIEEEKPSVTAAELFEQGKIRPQESPKKSSGFSPRSPKPKHEKKTKGNQIVNITKQEQASERLSVSTSKPIHRSTKSFSEIDFQKEEEGHPKQVSNSKSSYYYFFTNWKLKDFILFRSASEGRADDKDRLKKYTAVNKKTEEIRKSSFRSTSGSSSSSGTKRRPVSALEFHYKPRKAVEEDMKRRTYLPYTTGLLGCDKVKPTVSLSTRSPNPSLRR